MKLLKCQKVLGKLASRIETLRLLHFGDRCFRTLGTAASEMSIGLDLGLTGSGLRLILLDLDWNRTINCFRNLGAGPE